MVPDLPTYLPGAAPGYRVPVPAVPVGQLTIMPEPLSNRQQHILDFIGDHRCAHGRPPTIGEIADAVPVLSPRGAVSLGDFGPQGLDGDRCHHQPRHPSHCTYTSADERQAREWLGPRGNHQQGSVPALRWLQGFTPRRRVSV
jgi:hypothetical protein